MFGPNPEQYFRTHAGGEDAPERADDRHVAAVRDVSFRVEPGETFVVMGLSGSGKSTLIRCLARLIELTAGSVLIDGARVHSMSSAELRELRRHKCAMVFQHFGLFPHRRVLDNVAYGLEVTGMRRSERERRAREVTDLVGLGGWEQHYPDEISGGMKQRVGLARALAVDPQLLFFDEPFSALDPLIRRELQDELVRLARVVRKTFIFITHDMSEALKLGDRIAIMRDGRLVQIGRPEDILLRPVDDYVRRFTADAPRLQILSAGSVAGDVMSVRSSDAPLDVAELLDRRSAASAFVVDDSERLVGHLTRDAARRALDAGDSTVLGHVRQDVSTVSEETDLEQVIPLLADGGSLAVVDRNRRLVGSIDPTAVLRGLVKAAPDDPSSSGPNAAPIAHRSPTRGSDRANPSREDVHAKEDVDVHG